LFLARVFTPVLPDFDDKDCDKNQRRSNEGSNNDSMFLTHGGMSIRSNERVTIPRPASTLDKLPTERTGVQRWAPEGAKRPTSPSAATPVRWAALRRLPKKDLEVVVDGELCKFMELAKSLAPQFAGYLRGRDRLTGLATEQFGKCALALHLLGGLHPAFGNGL
jgi:hypothetical protein